MCGWFGRRRVTGVEDVEVDEVHDEGLDKRGEKAETKAGMDVILPVVVVNSEKNAFRERNLVTCLRVRGKGVVLKVCKCTISFVHLSIMVLISHGKKSNDPWK